ncbi:DUF4184 family protein [Microbacterium suwonense]|uniref:Cell wall anchor protein n=1 Tax=Microbacterium suwonense TaxID=683047 RepID=A0ABM8FR40_9MICO|nr:DUF4184 family protein [Microbacterium suwonense]BDZ37824.1 hypothetical protein GCM10025863_04380 [Microbacterium suwonense]
MPFTPSHAVVALPFVRTPLVPAAIAIGAMTPDLPLFLRGVGLSYGFTHSPVNIVWTALIALLLLAMWGIVLRPGLVRLAPDALAARLPQGWGRTSLGALRQAGASRWTLGSALWLVVSLVLGVLSHIAWDLFTHEGRWGMVAIPLLQQSWGPLPGYKWLQHGSSLIGLLIIAACALVWLRGRDVAHRPRTLPAWLRWSWYLTLPAFLIAGWAIGLALYGPLTEAFTLQHLAYRTLPAASGLWGAMTVLLCVAIVLTTPAVGHPTDAAPRTASEHRAG